MSEQRKAVALVSGGLDSMLAVRVMQEQGIHVEGINFFTGFCVEGHTHAIRKKDQQKPKRNNALWAAEQLGITLHIVDIIEEYKDVVINPKHGYGAPMIQLVPNISAPTPANTNGTVFCARSPRRTCRRHCLNARAGSTANGCTTSPGVRANRSSRWPGPSVSRSGRRRPAAAAS
ncbi:MAG: hypothetical protein P8Z31_00420 [Gammaproteobacteria bacterium]